MCSNSRFGGMRYDISEADDPFRLIGAHVEPYTVAPAVRIQQNILAKRERQLLNWLCARLPSWVMPDHLTALGFVAAFAIAAGYALSAYRPEWLWLSIISFFINWFGDSLDGSLARFRKIERPKFGYFIDHSADSLGNLFLMIGIGFSPYVRLDIAMFGAAAYLLLSIHTFIAARVVDEFRLSYLAGGPTELRLVLIAMSLCMLGFGPQIIGASAFTVFDAFIGGLAIILIVLFIAQTLITARMLERRGV
jgi:archaetidylinositol phosphate synthase